MHSELNYVRPLWHNKTMKNKETTQERVSMENYVCCYCEQFMSDEQIICCDTYKGKMLVSEFIAEYGELSL